MRFCQHLKYKSLRLVLAFVIYRTIFQMSDAKEIGAYSFLIGSSRIQIRTFVFFQSMCIIVHISTIQSALGENIMRKLVRIGNYPTHVTIQSIWLLCQ